MIKKSLICSFCLFFIFVFLCTTISIATVDVVTENKEVQSAYEAFIELQTAMNENELGDLKTALSKLENITDIFDDSDEEEWEKIVNEKIGIGTFLDVIFDVGDILSTVDYYEAFCANKNVKTSLEFVEIYNNLTDDSKQKIKVMISEIESVYQEANTYLPSNKVKIAYKQIIEINDALESGFEEEVQALKDDIQEMKDTVMNMNSEEMHQLAMLLDVKNEPAAYDYAARCWNYGETIINVGNAYKAYCDSITKETAEAFIKVIEEQDEILGNRNLIKEFFGDMDIAYNYAVIYYSSPNVIEVYNYFLPVQEALFNGVIEELENAVKKMEEKIDIFNEFSDEEMEQLAVLLDVEDAEEAFNIVFSDWIDANVLISVYDVYSSYTQNPNEETITAFVEMIDGYDDIYEDRTLLEYFFPYINDDYTEASKLINNDVKLFETSENQEFTVGTDKNLIFILDYNRVYGKVFVDDKELSEENGDYSWNFTEGTYPTITLSEDYIKTIKVGKHNIKFMFNDGGKGETTFTIVEKEENKLNDIENNITDNNSNKDNNVNKDNNSNKDNNLNNPQTGDNIITLITIFAIATLGAFITIKLNKNSSIE